MFIDFGITLFLSFEMQWMPGMLCVTWSWTQFAYLNCMRASNNVTYQLRQHTQNDRVANVKGHGKLPSPYQFIILCFIFILMTFPAYIAYVKGCYTFYYLLGTVSSVSRSITIVLFSFIFISTAVFSGWNLHDSWLFSHYALYREYGIRFATR